MLRRFVDWVDGLNDWVGRTVSWLGLGMVGITFLIVVLRYCFSLGWVWMQELVLFLHAIIFLAASGWALKRDAHVRVDIFYRGASERYRHWVNLLGSLFLLLPTCALIWYQAWPFVWDSWEVLEGSKDGGGLEAVYFIKTFILVFALLLFLQGVALMGRSWLGLREGR